MKITKYKNFFIHLLYDYNKKKFYYHFFALRYLFPYSFNFFIFFRFILALFFHILFFCLFFLQKDFCNYFVVTLASFFYYFFYFILLYHLLNYDNFLHILSKDFIVFQVFESRFHKYYYIYLFS